MAGEAFHRGRMEQVPVVVEVDGHLVAGPLDVHHQVEGRDAGVDLDVQRHQAITEVQPGLPVRLEVEGDVKHRRRVDLPGRAHGSDLLVERELLMRQRPPGREVGLREQVPKTVAGR
jgi:hypothetical protein